MFSPQGELYVDLVEVNGGITAEGGTPVSLVVASLPPTPGRSNLSIGDVYDITGRVFGTIDLSRPASFSGTGLPSSEKGKVHQVMHFNNVDFFVAQHAELPMVGVAFDNGVSIDAAMSDEFFGIYHAVYADTKSLRLGYERDIPISARTFWGGRFHYTRQHASGDSIFKNVSGHGVDGKVFTNIALPYGQVEFSVSHDVFIGGEFEFLGRGFTMKSATASTASVGYAINF